MKKIHYTDNYLLKPYHPVTVFIIGAGGTGSQVVTNLARMNAALQASGPSFGTCNSLGVGCSQR